MLKRLVSSFVHDNGPHISQALPSRCAVYEAKLDAESFMCQASRGLARLIVDQGALYHLMTHHLAKSVLLCL